MHQDCDHTNVNEGYSESRYHSVESDMEPAQHLLETVAGGTQDTNYRGKFPEYRNRKY